MAKKNRAPGTRTRKVAEPLVTLRVTAGANGVIATVPRSSEIDRLAKKWMYVLRNRARWSDDEDLRAAIRERAKEDLIALGVAQDALTSVVARQIQHIEVEFHEPRDHAEAAATNDAAAVFPWEFVLSSATKVCGRSYPLIVTRLLRPAKPAVIRPAALASRQVPSRLLFVESAPGRLESTYSFASEETRLAAATRRTWNVSPTESLAELTNRVGSLAPQVIHVSGVDNHQAAFLIPGFYEADEVRGVEARVPQDGMVARGSGVAEEPVPYDLLAKSLVRPRARGAAPWLVTFNLYYSAARTARECVRRGAYAALGFLDEIDDGLAEYFFQGFYWAWREGKNIDLPRAFGRTWTLLREAGSQLFGTGIVLWLSESAFVRARQHILPAVSDVDYDPPELYRLPTVAQRRATRQRPMSEVLQVAVDVPSEVNYSLLHNARPFLGTLTLSKLVDHTLDEVSVTVDLNVGSETHAFRHTELLLNEPQRVLTDQVTVPLTAPLLRSLRERVQTTVYVRVSWDGRTACELTRPVTLLPVDEWYDDTTQNPWLPSFVLPRDPAVAQIVTAARRYLVTLQDDPSAGFDGYQSVESEDQSSVDLQVQAIWTALVHEYKILYINPPPAYSHRNQRLRTPSEIVSSTSGTCVDLALLLAACLEYIDVYPVLVLLSGHAFVGYWRSDVFHEEFCRIEHVPRFDTLEIGPEAVRSAVGLVDKFKWRLAQQQYREVQSYLRRDKLRVLEATGLCSHFSFSEAMDEGLANMRSLDEFDSLLDIRLARSAKPSVTPLPILGPSVAGEQ